jgi:tRNA U34 5-methylaminomethyl-2-thiouridine-forming methyltransferase MnmC
MNAIPDRPLMSNSTFWLPQLTADGSFTFFSKEFGEAFHSRQGAKAEAFQKFAQATDLEQKAQQDCLRLLDICYGLGYNTAAALETIWAVNPDCRVELYGLELDVTVPQAAIDPALIQVWSPEVQPVLRAIAVNHQNITSRLAATLLIGDARQTVQTLSSVGFQADAILFDPFSPRRCPQLWTVEFFAQATRCLAPTGKLATYSRSAAVRSAMRAAGLQIGTIPLGKTHLPHEWSQGTVGSLNAQTLHPLSQMEQEHLQTRAAIPYRDPSLRDAATVILQRHQEEQQHSSLESTSNWRRRWGIR